MKNRAENIIRLKYQKIFPTLNERSRRYWAATEAYAHGWGGIAIVGKATGLSKATIHKGLKEIQNRNSLDFNRLRKNGGGRKKIIDQQPNILDAIESIVDPTSRGDPESPLRWSSKSVRKICKQLNTQNYKISFKSVSSLLKKLGYSLQANKKTKEGKSHQDRDAQFHFINKCVSSFHKNGQPTISVDTKKKELIGNFKNKGQEYHKQSKPIEVNGHDFPDKILGKVVPYGVYDIGKNKGWVSVGISGDTAEFAVNTIRTWWYKMGQQIYQNATELLITADCSGSNGYRVRLWKKELQRFANETGLNIRICHFPPATSKWNKIEHRMFSYISINWRGKPLINRETVVKLIGSTTSEKGLEIRAVLDENEYKTGIVISDEEYFKLNIEVEFFHPEWNYVIKANQK